YGEKEFVNSGMYFIPGALASKKFFVRRRLLRMFIPVIAILVVPVTIDIDIQFSGRPEKISLCVEFDFFVILDAFHKLRKNGSGHHGPLPHGQRSEPDPSIFTTDPGSYYKIGSNPHIPTIGLILGGSCFTSVYGLQLIDPGAALSRFPEHINHDIISIRLKSLAFLRNGTVYQIPMTVGNRGNKSGSNVYPVIGERRIRTSH